MDRVSGATRSRNMAAVRSRDTAPEMVVRREAHRLGYRYRLHVPELPGSPDLVFPRFKKVIFVHGCFWHQHVGCKKAKRPEKNTNFWNAKLDRNVERDAENLVALSQAGWQSLVIWECQTNQRVDLEQILTQFLDVE